MSFRFMKVPRVCKPKWAEAKYGSVKTKRKREDGSEIEFDSILEASFRDAFEKYGSAYDMESVELRVPFVLLDPYSVETVKINKAEIPDDRRTGRSKYRYSAEYKTVKVRPITYVCDFVIKMKSGKTFHVDAKGVETRTFKLKKKMFERRYKRPLVCVPSKMINDMSIFRFLKDNQ